MTQQPPIRTRPIAHAAQWSAVMETAGYVCQCTGACGCRHSRTGGRCDAWHDGHRHGKPVRLIAAPEDLSLTAREAVTVPTEELRAWCPSCYNDARRRASATRQERQRGEQPQEEPATLF